MSPCPTCGGPRELRSLRLNGWLQAVLLAVPFVVATVVGAPLLQEVAEGGDRTHLPLWRIPVVVVALLAAIVAVIRRPRRAVCARCDAGGALVPAAAEPGVPGSTRRTVLRAIGAASAATVGAVAGFLWPNRGWIVVGRNL